MQKRELHCVQGQTQGIDQLRGHPLHWKDAQAGNHQLGTSDFRDVTQEHSALLRVVWDEQSPMAGCRVMHRCVREN